MASTADETPVLWPLTTIAACVVVGVLMALVLDNWGVVPITGGAGLAVAVRQVMAARSGADRDSST